MLTRIVRMTFLPDKVEEFKAIFEASMEKIRNFEGCHGLELWQDKENPCVFITHSQWQDEYALEKYRQSSLFQSTWA
ncbi:MAG: putative quinol monooxygenase, partial [Flammeovirgaceae bacterium]|nr:putative quinol monooxygenase [Flammeovirgaceae bacterium]